MRSLYFCNRRASKFMLSILISATVCLVSLFNSFEAHAVQNPIVTGPIPATAPPGDPSHNYPFFSTIWIPPASGYVEEEFFMEGTAQRFTTPPLMTGTVTGSGFPYKVRMIVRRPSSAAQFSGKVVIEWLNVTNNFELDVQWNRAYDLFIREGWAYVGVGVQRAGIVTAGTALRDWNPSRYGTLDVTVGGTLNDDSLKYDIFSQAAQAVMNPVGVDPLGGLSGRQMVIATGDSQSTSNLGTYLNSVHPLDPIYQGFELGGVLTVPIRTDISQKVFKVISEYDANSGEVRIRRPDTSTYVAWEVAGASHTDYHNFLINGPIRLRDEGVTGTTPDTQNCVDPARSRINLFLVHQAAYDWIARWILTGVQPPSMPQPLTVLDFNTRPVTFARDSNGLVQGGIRLADMVVPTALNNGWNTAGKPPTSAASCQQAGTHVPFSQATLTALYPTLGGYENQVLYAAKANAVAGFILPVDFNTLRLNTMAEVLGQPQSEQIEAQQLGHPPFIYP
jgi:hypothetical protein